MKTLNKQLNEYMDFSDYPKDHPNYDITNKKEYQENLKTNLMVN